MKKKLITLLLAIGVIGSTPIITSITANATPLQGNKQESTVKENQSNSIIAHTTTKSNEIYNKFNNFDLQHYNVSLKDGKISISQKAYKGSSFAVIPNYKPVNTKEAENIINSNQSTKDLIEKELKEGKQIVGFSVTKRVMEQTTNEKTKETSCKFLTNEEVNSQYKDNKIRPISLFSTNAGIRQTMGELTLTSLVVRDPNFSGNNNEFNVVGNAMWNVGSFHSPFLNGQHEPSTGLDFMGITFPTGFEGRGGDWMGFKAFNQRGDHVYASLSAVNNNGFVYQFNEMQSENPYYLYTRNISEYAQIRQTGNWGGSKMFKVTYIHTYGSFTPTIGISASTSGVGGSIGLRGTSKQISVVSPVYLQE